MHDLDFPFWLRVNHFINLFCIFLLMRSGIQILADHPKLYWNDHTTPGSEMDQVWEESHAQRSPLDVDGRSGRG